MLSLWPHVATDAHESSRTTKTLKTICKPLLLTTMLSILKGSIHRLSPRVSQRSLRSQAFASSSMSEVKWCVLPSVFRASLSFARRDAVFLLHAAFSHLLPSAFPEVTDAASLRSWLPAVCSSVRLMDQTARNKLSLRLQRFCVRYYIITSLWVST